MASSLTQCEAGCSRLEIIHAFFSEALFIFSLLSQPVRAQGWSQCPARALLGSPIFGAAGASPEQGGDGGNRQDRHCRGLCLAELSHPRGWPQAKEGPGEESTLGWWCSVLGLAMPMFLMESQLSAETQQLSWDLGSSSAGLLQTQCCSPVAAPVLAYRGL